MRILLVDDDVQVLGAMKSVLEFDDHDVVTALGGQAGVAAFESSHAGPHPFDIVITDLGMPHVDGCYVASAIKKSSPETVVVLLTGSGSAPAGSNPADFDFVVGKPIRIGQLRDVLAKFAPLKTRAGPR